MTLNQFRPVREWIEQTPNPFFPTYSSFEWFCRHNRDELVKSGCYIRRAGRAPHLVGPGIDDVILSILRRESADART